MAGEKDLEKAKEKARNVKLFAHDIHGVLTPNTFMVDIEGKSDGTPSGIWTGSETFPST
jgi:hypothetical protein